MTRSSNIIYRFLLWALLTSLCEKVLSQDKGIEFDSMLQDYGSVSDVHSLSSEFIVKNTGATKIYFMRADVSKTVKVRINKKALLPGDTSLITVVYNPITEGKFNEEIKLVASAYASPLVLVIKGNIKNILVDDNTACYYFGKGKKRNNTNITLLPATVVKKPAKEITIPVTEDTLVELPAKTGEVYAVETPKTDTLIQPVVAAKQQSEEPGFSADEFKPNNIVFLIDVSGSMGDSLKLPLLKIAMHKLIENLRDVDKVTIITYADSVSKVCEGVSGASHVALEKIIDRLRAKGYTRGAKAILYSLDVALQHYMADGNNQIFMASDGKFPFYDGHYKIWSEKQGEKNILLSTIALGDDKQAVQNLKEIANKGKGSFLRIKNSHQAQIAIVDEIKLRSKRF